MGNVNKKPAPPPAGPVLVSGNMQMFGFPAWIVMLGVYAGLHMLSYAVVVSGAFGRDSSLSKNPHLAAHFLPQLFGFAILAYLGGGGWLHADMPSIDPGPGAYISFGEQIAMHMLSFQLYEIAACIPAPRLRGKFNELIGHHVITLLLSYLAYKHQAYHYWAPCFMGMPEISSVPLAVMDHLKNFKPLAQRFPNLNEASQVIFSLLFLPIRGVYWPCEQRSQPSRASHVDRGAQPCPSHGTADSPNRMRARRFLRLVLEDVVGDSLGGLGAPGDLGHLHLLRGQCVDDRSSVVLVLAHPQGPVRQDDRRQVACGRRGREEAGKEDLTILRYEKVAPMAAHE